MSKYGLLIHYEYCSGCRSCDVACRKEHDIPAGKWGMNVVEEGPWQVSERDWEWNNLPIPTKLCDLCEERVSQGRKPSCVHHCLANCIEFGTIEELAKSLAEKDHRAFLVIP